jgi:hypothetical protein
MDEGDRREEDYYRKRSVPYAPHAMVLRKELTTTGAQILTGVAAPLKYTVSNWWQTKQGLVKFQKELMKYASSEK